ncbi:MAG TPA: ABC transporter substrate-binding protein, partial [Anaerolineae bacterium]|nr:ABC transporter substrate-binding protein [Anaerolineae bacterium]
TPEIVRETVVQEKTVEKVVTATPAPESTKASPGADTLVVNLDRVNVGGMDASQTVESTGKKAAFHISETLVEFDEQANDVKPKLAERWEADPDGLTYTFYLRKGVKFQDGTDFNADAVVTSLMRIYDEKHPLHSMGTFPYASFTPIKSVDKVDDYTVKVTATREDPIFLWRMSMEAAYIQSPTAMEKWGKEYTNHAVGTGPYRLAEFDPQSKIVLERFDDYWGAKPSVKTIVFKINPDDQSRVADLLAGNVDIITRPPADLLETLRSTPGIKVDVFPLRWLGYINLNSSVPPLNDKLVRQAVNYAFDRETLSNVLNNGTTKAQYNVWFEGAYAYEPNFTKYTFDVEKAKTLLEQAGWTLPAGRTIREKDGKPLEIRLAQAGTLYGPEAPIPELFQANMRDIGMDVKIVKIDPAVFFDEKVGGVNPANAEATVFGWIAFLPDPSFVFDRFTKGSIPPGGYNLCFYSDPKVEDLYTKSLSELDLEKRAEYFKEIQRIVTEEAVMLPNSLVTLPMAWNERVSGFHVRGNVTLDLTGVTIK